MLDEMTTRRKLFRWWEWVALALLGAGLAAWSPGLRAVYPQATPVLEMAAFLWVTVCGIVDQRLSLRRAPHLREFRYAIWTTTGFAFSSVVAPESGWRGWLMVVVLLSTYFATAKSLEHEGAKHRERELALHAARDEALRLKLAPHFLFNALETVKAQLASDPQGAGSTVDRLAALLRQVLDGSGRQTVPLKEELSFVESYLGIERLRLGDRLRVKLEIPEAAEAVEIPPLALQALVENAVKHGVAPREDGGEIRIWAEVERFGELTTLRLAVENPLAEGAEPGAGVGLAALRARLRKPGDLETEARGGRFRAQLTWYPEVGALPLWAARV
jgi:hypothetical protein